MESLESFEPLVNPIRVYRNNRNRTLKTGEEKLAEVLAKIASMQKSANETGIDRTKVRTYAVKLRLKKSYVLRYKCYDCGSCFANPEFLEMHEESHLEPRRGGDIDLRQETPASGKQRVNLKQNAWFVGDFEDDCDEGDEDGEEEHIVQLDCTVEEGEDIFDITFDRTKCEKTYTMKYKVKKEPVGKCEVCEKLFYSHDCLKLHKLEHEKFLDIANIEPSININRSPPIEESTMTLDDSFYEALDVSDILERNGSAGIGRKSASLDGVLLCDGQRNPEAGFTLKYSITPRSSGKSAAFERAEKRLSAETNGQLQCQLAPAEQQTLIVKMEPLSETEIKQEPVDPIVDSDFELTDDGATLETVLSLQIKKEEPIEPEEKRLRLDLANEC
ncbi:uncharacterized protein LOC125949100 [Anopheles darlingi]|uniref:uncharacterized protein LOC125949100 n=1 Tax=Anopheles darlingi TaxID=43151 RepID=UPI00210023CA|nr:uncharacterized protein LOC125949100 [Anopheles darlingi]